MNSRSTDNCLSRYFGICSTRSWELPKIISRIDKPRTSDESESLNPQIHSGTVNHIVKESRVSKNRDNAPRFN